MSTGTRELPYTLQLERRHNGLATVYSGTDAISGQPVLVALLGNGAAKEPAILSGLEAELPLLQNADPYLIGVLGYDLETQPPYVMIEPLAGSSLRQIVEQAGRGLMPSQALAYVRASALCVQDLHSRGAVHGAICIDSFVARSAPHGSLQTYYAFPSPESLVLITRMVSEIVCPDLFVSTSRTDTRDPQDRHLYLAPELAGSGGERAAPVTDVYSLGVLLYHLLTGTAPGIAPGIAPGRPESLAWLRSGQTPPLEETIAEAALRARLQKFIQLATSREPLHRWPDMSAFVDALDQIAPSGGRVIDRPAMPVSVPRPSWTVAQPQVARLRSLASGNVYTITGEEISVGLARGSGFSPDISLHREPEGQARYISQHHIDLIYEQDQWYVRPSKQARNPTFLDGEYLAPGTRYPLRDGAEIAIPELRLQFLLQAR